MNSINWSNFNPSVFTLFCNALLSFEIGNNFVPFSAPGRDGGIDGQYEGEYGGETGKWRFQYKFHKVARKQGFNSLKAELKNEIKSLKDENIFVLITNVELLPQELKELKELFTSCTSELPYIPSFKVWDGAKIFSLYIQYPLLELWLNEGFKTAQLLEYRDYFSKEMKLNEFDPGTLTNIFVSREKDIEKLKTFLSTNNSLFLISGEAGIGKTRLVVEFFENHVRQLENWKALVLASKDIQVDTLNKALSSNKKTIILIDDAHTYTSETIGDLKRLADGFEGSVKLILTSRKLQAFESLQLIKDYDLEDEIKIELGNLERQEAQRIFESYLLNTKYRHYINELIELSYGRPILIVAILKAIQEGISISKIREGGFLKKYVVKYFEEFYKIVSSQTEISKFKLKRLLQNIALIEPFNYTNNEIISELSTIHKIEIPEINLCLKTLIDFSFVSGRFEQSIKPDYYSDILLLDINQEDASGYISQFNTLLDNIIFNLSSVDEADNSDSQILDEILNKYVSWILVETDADDLNYYSQIALINRIFNTIRRIVFVRPEIAKKSVEMYLACMNKADHPIAIELQKIRDSGFSTGYTSLEKIESILYDLNALPEYYSFVLKSSIKLHELTGDKQIPTIYSFSKRDVIDRYSLSVQNYFIDRFMELAKKDDSKSFPFLLEILNKMLSLDFNSTENSNNSPNAIVFTTYYLPETAKVKDFRLKVLQTLVDAYEDEDLKHHKQVVLKQILDVPRIVFATDRNKKPFRHDEEIEAVLNFLEQHTINFGIAAQKEIFDRLYWFERWKIDEKFIPQLDRIKKIMLPKSLAEELGHLFGNSEISLKGHNEMLSEFENKISEILKEDNFDEISLALYEFLSEQENQPYFFYDFLKLLVKKSTKHGLSFHDLLFEKDYNLYYHFGDSILSVIYFEKDENTAYWERIDKLEVLNKSEADNFILSIYGRRVPGSAVLSDKDIQTILRIYNKKDPDNNFNLASGLQSIISYKYPNAYTIVSDYLDRANQRDAEMFFLWLSDNKMASSELVKDLVIGHSVRFRLSHQIERVLTNVLNDYGSEIIFDYLISRYNFKKNFVEQNRTLMGYEFLPNGDHSNLFNNQIDLKERMFFKALEWYLKEDNSKGQLYYGKDIFEYLQPSNLVTDSTYETYNSLLDIYSNDINKLQRIAESLDVFEVKNSLLVKLILKGYSHLINIDEAEDNLKSIKQAGYSFYSALTSLGVKTGTPGQPFQVDLDLRDLLESELKLLPMHVESRSLIISALKSINSEIERSSDLDNETW
ncbi:hypothetical protein HCX49_05850 [Sphingobacterium kitahiroshimense]|uniref:nSTAND3 domain-containing NTPase n=1 Tax=Sphingobacterium sp. B16(2022) TaxID=2914044 RepID=UPI00143CBF30|nr:ATP-binding protein [Sphingobacterium sp. B16(2022)]NJI72722.1 hypothetical protein [Sphingobacterium sp. B16(2022)]